MHEYLIREASDTQLREFASNALSMLKETHHDLYEELEDYLYKEMYGCHFNAWLLKKALSHMENEDGTSGGHWSLDQTTSVAKQYDIKFTDFNEYDWNYIMNMIYSDYYGVVPNDLKTYVYMAKRFLEDKDAVRGKAYHYYMSMRKK